jgi:dipeptidyl aminopeptidase/acylaminoacyl peptidase
MKLKPLHLAAAAISAALLLSQAASAQAPAKPGKPAAKTSAKATKAPKRYTIDQFLQTVSIGGASFSADEKRILFSSNETGIFNAYAIPAAGGKAEAFTKSAETTRAVSFFPNDDRALISRDAGGNENDHLYVRELDGSEKDLTPGEKVKASFEGWSPDGGWFYVSTNERDAKMFDLYLYNAKSYERRLIFKNEKALQIETVSRDGKWIAFNKPNTTNDSDIWLYDVAKAELKHITPHTGNISYSAQRFDPSSQKLLLLSDEGSEYSRVKTYDLASGKFDELEKADWDISFTYFSRDGRFRVTGINQDAATVVKVTTWPDNKPVALPKGLPAGEMRSVSFSKSGSLMAFYINADRSPSNLFVVDLKAGKAKQLTQSLSKEINPNDLVDAEVIRFKSFDGMTIPAIYWKPKEASAANKVPAIVMVHGGPGGQARRGYSAMVQHLVNHGYAVLDINNRGSSGYGKTFFAADDGKHGREPLWDCIEAKTWLAATGHVDIEKIGIMGGSYGGYMVLSAMAFRPEAFKVGVNIFGVSNWIRTLESIPPYWESFRKALYTEIGDPVKDREFLMATSPLFHAKEIKRPLIVIQGANDPRVIKPESDDIVAAVQKNNVPVEYVVFPDEGHGFSKKKNNLEGNKRILEFLDKYLKKG